MTEVERLSHLKPGLPGCPRCAELEKIVRDLLVKVAALEETVAALQERLNQNSRNSHKPPSQDPPDAPARRKKTGGKRKPGGQLGHKGKNRELLPMDRVDEVVPYVPTACAHCGAPLEEAAGPDDPPPTRHQIVELPERLCQVIEHQAHARTCASCGKVTRAEIPKEFLGSCFGPKLVAAVAFLSGSCHLSKRQIEEVVEDLFGSPISLGSIANMEREATAALGTPYQEAAEVVRNADAKNLDETGWKVHGAKAWLWVAATTTVAVYAIHASRGRKGLNALLGAIRRGIFTSDRWAVYNKRATRFRQLCWAHLLRDFQKLIDRGGESKKIGMKAKAIGEQLFMVWKDFKAGAIDRETLKRCLPPLRAELKAILTEGLEVTASKTVHFCENLLALEPAMWTFVRCEGVEPTNNHAERLMRKGVLWRKGSFGTWSNAGSRFVERILTVMQTCRLQKRPVLSFLVDAITAHRYGQPAPSFARA